METYDHPEHIRINDFDYDLPDDRIAQFPLETRDRSKLLIYKNGLVSEDHFFNITKHLPGNSLVIFNETRVIHARLHFYKPSGSHVEIFCLEPLAPFQDHLRAFQQSSETVWKCMVGNSKRWKSGSISLVAEHHGAAVRIEAERLSRMDGGISTIRFRWFPDKMTFAEVLEAAGKMPLPPYINRAANESDELTYQTIYARQDGSVAAPTAGLHFSDKVLSTFTEKNIDTLKFTLHVGAGTFKPVASEELSGHEMHSEQIYLPLKSIEKLESSISKPLIAVGTTTTRLLESLYWHGVKVIRGISSPETMNVNQWDPYGDLKDSGISRSESLKAVIKGCNNKGIDVVQGNTSLLIAPGYSFRFPDILITNFHQPKSTLLLLIAAFIGEDWMKAYEYALEHEFRFLSYGDSCLFFQKIILV